ncbi:MAG: NHL repeat-containing protein [Gammaproteobacteria bacterium]|jgi:DNA-binding beta-propeller fold protein YncE
MEQMQTRSKVFLLGLVLAALSSITAGVGAAQPEFLATSDDSFAHPHDLELHPGGQWVFVADVNHHDIKVLDARTLKTLATIGDGELDSPHDVHFDKAGRLLVADSGNDRVVIYKLDGLKAKAVAELSEQMSSPEGVTTDADGYIYVASTANHRVLKFNGSKLVDGVGGRGDGDLEFVRPHDIELGADGLLYLGDPGNNRIQVLTRQLQFKGSISNNDKPFSEPKYLALDDKNWLYVADQHNNRLRIFNDQRTELAVVTEAGRQSLNYIEGVEVANGYLWIADTYNNRIVVFRWQP